MSEIIMSGLSVEGVTSPMLINVSKIGLSSSYSFSRGTGVFCFDFISDENGDRIVDENGENIIGQRYPLYSSIKDAAAARGIKFGAATNTAFMNANSSLINSQTSIIAFSGGLHPGAIQPTQGNFDWTSLDDAVSTAASFNLPWRFHLLNYPAHDMPWVNGTTVNSSNWQDLIDSHFEAIANRLLTHENGKPTSIDVTNEIVDGTQTNGFLRNPWYNAGGREWAAYMFNKARELWPDVPLYLNQDLQEEIVPLYGDRFIACLKVIDYLQSVNAPIDGINLQGHIAWNRPWDAVAFRNQLKEFKARGLKIIIGEHDVQRDDQLPWDIPNGLTSAEVDKLTAYRSAQWADVVLPFVDGGEFIVWELSDSTTPWGEDQRPCLYDDNLILKRDYYNAILEPFLSRS